MNIQRRDDIIFCGQGIGFLGVECCMGIYKAFEEFKYVPGYALTSSSSSFFASIYYSGYDIRWFEKVLKKARSSDFINYSIVDTVKTIFGKTDHMYTCDGLKDTLDMCLTSRGERRVKTSITRKSDFTSILVPATKDAVLASMAFPYFFKPVVIDGEEYIGGSVINTLPVPSWNDLQKYKHVFVFVAPQFKLHYNTLPTNLINLLITFMDREIHQLRELEYFDEPNVTLIRPPSALSGNMFGWSKGFELKEAVCKQVRETLACLNL